LTGRIRLRVRAPTGARLIVSYAEVLTPCGDLWTEALRTARQTDEYICSGETPSELYEPYFSVLGFRYTRISLSQGKLDRSSIEAIAIWADMELTGEFSCSYLHLNQLQSNIVCRSAPTF